ncbi:hypothetical protein [Pseudomonas sp. KCJK8751]|uniref:hypothetical protein n=1 Tax=Pseudomonas sp. KCJK8751 TaxID=3344564 RepID=UPI0039069440
MVVDLEERSHSSLNFLIAPDAFSPSIHCVCNIEAELINLQLKRVVQLITVNGYSLSWRDYEVEIIEGLSRSLLRDITPAFVKVAAAKRVTIRPSEKAVRADLR